MGDSGFNFIFWRLQVFIDCVWHFRCRTYSHNDKDLDHVEAQVGKLVVRWITAPMGDGCCVCNVCTEVAREDDSSR